MPGQLYRGPVSGARPLVRSTSDEQPGVGKALLGAGAVGLGALVLRNPRLAKSAAGKLLSVLGGARYTSMLSGFSAPKSLLANVGEVATQAAERGSMQPLKQLFSRQTARDFGTAIRSGEGVGPVAGGAENTAGQVTRWTNPFGRLMGAADVTTRKVLQRSGIGAKEAEAAVLQKPLSPEWASALDSAPARVMFPFRRTPVNQFLEGMTNIKKGSASITKLVEGAPLSPAEIRQLAVLGSSLAGGTAHGAATSEDRFPVSVGLATAMANRYGVPYAMGVILGRVVLAGGNPATLTSQLVPFSEYGVTSTLADPLGPLRPQNLGIVRAAKQLQRR